jgi:hypothetical protein
MFGASDEQISNTRELSVHELNAMIPRKVCLNPDGGYTAVAMVLMLLSVGVVWFGALSYSLVQESRHREALSREGREAIAKVTRLTSGHSTYAHYTFHFGDADYGGESNLNYQHEPRWPDGRTKYAREGDLILVQFLPSDPSINHPSGWAWWSWWDVPPHLFIALFPIMGFRVFVYVLRERRFARIGWVTEGKVINCTPTGSRFRVDYEFYDEGHMSFDGANENSDKIESGSQIRVIYLRSNPRRNDIYPLTTFHTAGE